MCGRFTISVSYQELVEHLNESYHIENMDFKFDQPRYNVSPGQDILSVIFDGKKHRIGYLKWGFIPSFAKDEKIGFSMINAKSETIFEKPSFYESVMKRRCVVLADSFYEWKKDDQKKIPMRILVSDQKIFPIAAIWNTYQRHDGTKLHTVSLVTTKANELMKPIHERMPVILTKETQDIWLNPTSSIEALKTCFLGYDANKMHTYPVSSRVNQSSYDDSSCIEPIDDSAQTTLF